MMATPADLEDFAVGFALTEGLIEDRSEIENLEIVPTPLGVELRIWLTGDRAETYAKRRRSMAGPTGCGLCGIESLEAAMRPLPQVTAAARFSPQAIVAAMASLDPAQVLNAQTHAVHGAGFWTEREGLVALREDVGRHNALDKLVGALVRAGRTAADGTRAHDEPRFDRADPEGRTAQCARSCRRFRTDCGGDPSRRRGEDDACRRRPASGL